MIPSAVRGIFLLPPTAFFVSDRPGSPSINKEGIFPGIKDRNWEKFRHGGKNFSLAMGHGGKNSHIVGKIPTWSE
jgi:hypothetical protein